MLILPLTWSKAVLCSAGCCANTNMLVECSIAGSHQSNLIRLDLDVFCRGSAIIRSLTTAAGGSDDDVRHRDPRWRAAWSILSAPERFCCCILIIPAAMKSVGRDITANWE